MRIAVLGAGSLGRAVGAGWVRSGHIVCYGVPNPGDAKYANLEPDIMTVRVAAVAAEVIVLATPWPATQAAVEAAGDLAGRIVIDCTNPLGLSQDHGLRLVLGFGGSGGEQVAKWAAGAAVFKTLNQTGAEGMANAAAFAQPPVMFVAGDDEVRKPQVMRLVADLGFEALDAGPLRSARLLEPYGMLWIDQAHNRGGGRDFAFAVTRRPS